MLMPCGLYASVSATSDRCVSVDQLAELVGRRRAQRRDVPVGHHHQVAVVVGIEIEDDVAGLAAKDDQLRLIEDGVIGFRRDLP